MSLEARVRTSYRGGMKVAVRKRSYPDGSTVWTADLRGVVPAGETLPDRFRLTAPADLKTEAAVTRWAWDAARAIIANGRPVQTRKGKAVAEAKVAAEQAANAPLLRDHWPDYVERCRGNRQKPSTLATKISLADTYLLPTLGQLNLRQCCLQSSVDKLKKSLADVGHSRANSGLLLLRSILSSSAATYGLEVPEIELVKPDKLEKLRCYTPAEFEAMVTAARELGPRFLLPVLLGGEAGLRIGETIGLRWEALDLARGKIEVLASAWEGQLGSTKTGRPRTVPMTTRLRAALIEAPRTSEFVVSRVRGDRGMANHASMESVIRVVIARAGVPNRGTHGLRHRFATQLIMSQVPIHVVARLLGHTKVSTVTELYLGFLPGSELAAIAVLEP